MERFTQEQYASHACTMFHYTFKNRDDILKKFEKEIKDKVILLHKDEYSFKVMDILCEKFATDTFGNISLISIDVLRDKLAKKMALENYKVGVNLLSSKNIEYFEDFALEIMKCLINVTYTEQKERAKIAI
jgi:hypothetical protein